MYYIEVKAAVTFSKRFHPYIVSLKNKIPDFSNKSGITIALIDKKY